ncbi:protein kintoun [Biomphalaria glabrata]|nr:protein kintoun-like [Biomphalaria glabrata]
MKGLNSSFEDYCFYEIKDVELLSVVFAEKLEFIPLHIAQQRMRHYGVDIPNNMASERTLEDLNLSRDEVKRLGEALKDEQFRKLLCEYAEEISNPENMRKAEEEIAMMENERGMSVQFIHPEPGYVLKTTVNGSIKAFINICQNDKIDKPKSQKQTSPDGKSGLLWQIPHSFAPPKDDFDKSKLKCQVYDVVFHPDTYRMAIKNDRFKKLVEDTALDGIERQFGVTLDKNNIKRPKLKFKGMKTATILRERKQDSDSYQMPPDDLLNQMPYPYDSKTSYEKAAENEARHSKQKTDNKNGNKGKSEERKFTEPKYSITHRSHIDMSEYRNAPDAKTSTRPKELVIKIELPLLNSAAQANLDIFEKRLLITSVSPAAYKLDLALPYPVNEDEGTAKFDKSKRLLIVTLPVLPDKTQPLPFSEMSDHQSVSEITQNSSTTDIIDEHLVKELNTDNSGVSKPELQSLKNTQVNDAENNLFPKNVKWVLPDYQFSQDNETVSFVIKVKNVEENSTKMLFPQNSMAIIQFISYGAGCFPIYYSMCVKFLEGCCIASEHGSVDVSNDNLVFIILKKKESRGLWDTFEIGVDDTKLEPILVLDIFQKVRQFLTESNLQRELSELDQEATLQESTMPVLVEALPELAVVTMEEAKLTIEIKPPKAKKYKPEDEELDDEDYEPPSSAEIEVIHKHPTPNLHSILKTRTPSESSEEVNGMEPESPRSEGEELSSSFSKKRSVSFSNHVDKASFKSFASVSSMTTVLKSKRRRQRKRDEKRQGRMRRASEGTSSSEECINSLDAHSLSEGEGSLEKPLPKSGLSRALSDPGPNIYPDKVNQKEKKKNGNKKGKKGNHISDKKPESIPNDASVIDFRTSGAQSGDKVISSETCDNVEESLKGKPIDRNECGEVNGAENFLEKDGDKKKKIISEIRSKLAGGDTTGETPCDRHDSDDDDFVDAVSSMADEFSGKISITDKCDKENVVLTSCDQVFPVNEDDQKSGPQKKLTADSLKEHSDVETILSWEDGPQRNDSEHVTKCPFEFSNALIYELDID